MFSTADKTHHAAASHQKAATTSFFRKAGEGSFFGGAEMEGPGAFFSPGIQTKLSVSSPDDPQEKEADAVADQVMRMPEPVAATEKKEEGIQAKEEEEQPLQAKSALSPISISRKCEHCEKEEKAQATIQARLYRSIQRTAANTHAAVAGNSITNLDRQPSLYRSDIIQLSGRGPPAGSIPFEDQLAASGGGGSPLPDSTKQFMESRFQADFSDVRVHTGSYAENLSSQIHAQAFAHGNDIYFNAGKYSPHSEAGGTLLAHELTHTIQQGASPARNSKTAIAPSVSRKKSIQRSAAAVPAQLTAAVEKAKTVEGKIDANKTEPDGNRVGWQHLLEIFKTTFGEEMIVHGTGSSIKGAVAEDDIKKKREMHNALIVDKNTVTDRNAIPKTTRGSRDAMPSWCGIFVFWALNKSGVPMPRWKLGESMIKPEAARAPGSQPLPGDVAYRNAYSHYAIVESVNGANVTTVNGNTAGEDNLGGQVQTRDHPLSDWTAFFDPLLIKTGPLGQGEQAAHPVPKSLAELRKEKLGIYTKPEEEQKEQQENIQTKPELSNWQVNAKGELQTTAPDIHRNTPEEHQQKEEQQPEEEKLVAGPVHQMQARFEDRVFSTSQSSSSINTSSSSYQKTGTATDSSLTDHDVSIQSKVEAHERGPPVRCKGDKSIQRSVIDDALGYTSLGALLDCVEITDIDATSVCLLRKARDVAMHIPGYKALRVVLGRDPITGERVERNGHNLLDAAFDIMPGGTLLQRKLREQQQLEAAEAWIDTRIAGLEALVDGLFSEFEAFWDDLGITDFRSPMNVVRRGAGIVFGFISNLVNFALDAAKELLEMIKQYLLEKVVDFVKEHTTAYPLLTVILGEDPITKQPVDRNGTNILNALLELGGEEGRLQRQQMMETGTFQKVVAYIDEGIAVFGNLYDTIVQNFSTIWDAVSIDALMHPIATFQRIYNIFAAPVRKVLDFVSRVVSEILKLIKEVLFKRISAEAKKVRGYYLVTVLIGRDPFTNERVPRNVENIIHGFMSLMDGGEEQFQQMKESGAIARATQRIDAAVRRLNMTFESIVQLFIDLWNSFTFSDFVHPIATFQRIIAKFGEPIGRLIDFVIEIIKIVIHVILQIMNFPFDLINNIITRAMAAIGRIKRDPIGFLKNLLRAIKQGFVQFFDHILQHLIQGVVGWLMSELREAGVPELTDLSLRGVISWVLQVLGISMEKIWEKLAAHPRIGPQRVARIRSMINTLEGIWTFIKDVQERGMAAIWDKIQEQLSNLWNTILDAVKNWVMEQIINRIVTRLLSMLDPTGIMAVINSAIAIYSAIQSFIKYLREMLEIVNSFVNGVAEIAEGNITTAANYLERTMARAMPVVIGFLANQVGLSGIGRRVGEMIERAREMVDEALTWLVNKAVDTGMNLLDRVVAVGRSARDAVLGWLGLRKEFSTDNGMHHEIYFTGNQSNRQVVIASNNPESMDVKINRRLGALRRNRAQNQAKISALETALQLKGQMDTFINAQTSNQASQNPSTTDIQPQINNRLESIKQQLVIGGVDEPDIPLTNVTYTMENGRAHIVTAQPLTKLAGNTAGSDADGNPAGWNIATYQNSTRTRPGETTSSGRPRRILQWRQVHLLSAVLHGPGSQNWNLTPTNDVANGNLRTRERRVFNELNNNENPAVYTLYRTTFLYNNPDSPQNHPLVGSWNTKDFPSEVKLELQKEGEGSPTVIPIASNLPYPQADEIAPEVDYFGRFKVNIDGYFAETEREERDTWSVFARKLNLQRAIPNADVRTDTTERLRTYYNTNK